MKPVVRIILVLILAGIFCQLGFLPINKGYLKYHDREIRRLEEIFEDKTDYDILFLGSSRTYQDVYPRIIDSICRVNSFNAGVPGGKISEFKMHLEGYLVNHAPPRVVVLTLDMPSFLKPYEIYEYPIYYTLLNNHAISNTLSQFGYNVKIQRILPFTKAADLDDYAKEYSLMLLLGKGGNDLSYGEIEYKGFMSIPGHHIPANYKPELHTVYVSDEAKDRLYQIIDICKRHKIKLIFTYAPEYNFCVQKEDLNADSVFTFITATAQKNNIPYIRNDSLAICRDPNMFADINHLNKKGAMEYSIILAEELERVLDQVPDSIH